MWNKLLIALNVYSEKYQKDRFQKNYTGPKLLSLGLLFTS